VKYPRGTESHVSSDALQVSSNLIHSSLSTSNCTTFGRLDNLSALEHLPTGYQIFEDGEPLLSSVILLVTSYLYRQCQIASTTNEREATHMLSWKKLRRVL
jgi:hypothetical protein